MREREQRRPISINSANEAELEQIEGLGRDQAERIVSYREAHGPFKAWSELKKIRGLNEHSRKVVRREAIL